MTSKGYLLYHWKSKRVPKKHYFCFIDYAKAFDCVDHNKLWKILKEMGVQDHLTCLLRNLYVGQEATVRTGHGTTDWFQIGKGVHQSYILSPCLFNLYAEYISTLICWIDWLDLLAVQGTLKSLLQHDSLKASILFHSAFFIVQLSNLYMTTGKPISLKVCSLTICM